MYEFIGYIASALVAISLMMKSIVRLRWLNMAGAVVFCLYGLLIEAYPVFAMNLFIVFVNIYYLRKLSQNKERFELLRLNDVSGAVIRRFIVFHKKDIKRSFPAFELEELDHPVIFFVLRDMNLAGLFIADMSGGVLDVKLDYAAPAYRDFRTSNYLYGQLRPMLKTLGVRQIVAHTSVPKHADYLRRMGFKGDEKREGYFSLR